MIDSIYSSISSSFAMILATELGDKTFFIAAVLSMHYPRSLVWIGAVSALALMTLLSSLLGIAVVSFLPPWLVDWTVIMLMLYFGISMIMEGKGGEGEMKVGEGKGEMKVGEGETKMEEEEIEEEEGEIPITKITGTISHFEIFLKSFSLTFLAEWGDRSQMSTIALAAVENMMGVMIGAIVGHCLCTALAVLGGRFLARHVDERLVHLVGGTLFLGFGVVGVVIEMTQIASHEFDVVSFFGEEGGLLERLWTPQS